MAKSVIFTQTAPAPIGPYSQGIRVEGSLLFTAGQIPIDPKTGQVVEGDIKVQTRQALKNLQAILEAGKSSLDAVIKTSIYLKDMNEFS